MQYEESYEPYAAKTIIVHTDEFGGAGNWIVVSTLPRAQAHQEFLTQMGQEVWDSIADEHNDTQQYLIVCPNSTQYEIGYGLNSIYANRETIEEVEEIFYIIGQWPFQGYPELDVKPV